ncbi:MAG: hypothetical protein KIT80_13500 [Chitinophagaceae bacterium]|nr:hypothetical protein [Chitinophagaceae bacterium]MCW5927924.1 hypothetical protein [Chitinophagaceae bacterium]
MEITRSQYKNKPSIVCSTSRIRAEFIPEPGGKMVSFKDLANGYEYLVQRPGKEYKDQPLDGVYIDGECSGYDDMFPTIDACECRQDPWKGLPMGDHGEVWCMPWETAIKESQLILTVKSNRFPYQLQKSISFPSEQSLRISYMLENMSEHDFEFLWAGHFMFNTEPGTRIVVPDDCKNAISILSNANRAYGEVMDWPLFKDKEGSMYRADISRPPQSNGFEKYYFQHKLKEGWCKLIDPAEQKQLTVSFSAETVPYLGILMNENGWDNLYNIFIEPCTVCYDRPDVAKAYGQVSSVRAGEKYHWWVELTI